MTTAPVGTAPLRERVAEELRALLARRKVTPTELGRKLGRSQTWVWRRLEGEVAFDLNDLEAIAAALGVAPADLLPPDVRRGTEPNIRNSPVPERPADNRPPGRTSGRSGRGDRPLTKSSPGRRVRIIGALHPMDAVGVTA
jgi:transcriptional regulator with XRE-family HTH domain